MTRPAIFVVLAWLLTGVSCLLDFINPAPFVDTKDFSNNPVYIVGSTVNVAWSGGETGKGVSLVLYQLNETDGVWFGDMEYLTQGAVGVTRYSWLVGTRKDLSVSKMFYFSIFQEGKSIADSNSQYFNIQAKSAQLTTSSSIPPSSTPTAKPNVTSATSPSASTATSKASSSYLPSLSPSSSPTISPSASAPPASSQAMSEKYSNEFSTGAKIGVGVAVPIGLILCLGAGFLLFRRSKKKAAPARMMPIYEQHEHRYAGGSYYGSNLNEAPPKSPVEMGELGIAYPDYSDRTGAKTGTIPVRYEM